MRCIFCKKDSSSSPSREHILPEALGNARQVLPCGVVCDQCNNYFSRKVEGPVLDSQMFRTLRADRRIPNKRGLIPDFPKDELAGLPEYRAMSRFLAKVGLGILASRVLEVDGWNDEIVDKSELDALRCYVRFNIMDGDWPFSYRTLYPVNAVFRDQEEVFELLHEYDLLYTSTSEIYSVVAILGVEFVLNLGGPDIDGYVRWLAANAQRSPLYHKHAAQQEVATDDAARQSS